MKGTLNERGGVICMMFSARERNGVDSPKNDAMRKIISAARDFGDSGCARSGEVDESAAQGGRNVSRALHGLSCVPLTGRPESHLLISIYIYRYARFTFHIPKKACYNGVIQGKAVLTVKYMKKYGGNGYG